MREPENSWEISYVISVQKPNFEQKVSKSELIRRIGYPRASELEQWAALYFSYGWFSDCTKKYPPIKLPPKEN